MTTIKIEQVLLIEDDPSIRKIAEISLSKVGNWRVTSAESGLQALEVVSHEKPDVILLDVMMPDMDGLTTLKHLRERDSLAGTPIIFMTAKIDKDEADSYHNIGVAGVISKPFDPITLPSEIMRILERLKCPVSNE